MSEKQSDLAVQIYDYIADALRDVDDVEAVIGEVNELIEERGLSEAMPEAKPVLKAKTAAGKAKNAVSSVACPHCGSHFVRKNGSSNGKRQYVCKECKKTFRATTGTIAHGSHRDEATWRTFIEGSLDGNTLERLGEKCGFGTNTAYRWRMRLFSCVQNSQIGKTLGGIIQEDEFYTNLSCKGNKKVGGHNVEPDYKKYGFRDKPHMRGGIAGKSGLSREKICIATAIDGSKNIIGAPIGLGNVSKDGLGGFLDGRIDENSILVTDKSRAAITYADDRGLANVALDSRKESRKGVYNLQSVNSLHSVIQSLVKSRSSFATKNAEAYITWEAWKILNRDKSTDEKVEILLNMVTTGRAPKTCAEISSTPFPAVLIESGHVD